MCDWKKKGKKVVDVSHSLLMRVGLERKIKATPQKVRQQVVLALHLSDPFPAKTAQCGYAIKPYLTIE